MIWLEIGYCDLSLSSIGEVNNSHVEPVQARDHSDFKVAEVVSAFFQPEFTKLAGDQLAGDLAKQLTVEGFREVVQ